MQTYHLQMIYFTALEPEVTAWLTAHIRPGMSILSAGGYTGVHALYMARLLQGRGRLDVFEGWPENYKVMTDHLELNRDRVQLGVVHAHALCLAETSGSVVMAQGRHPSTHHIAAPDDTPPAAHEILATSVDDFWASRDTCVDVLMLDVEGWELPVLRGSTAMLTACHPTLIIEHHRVANLAPWLMDMGYQLTPLGERHTVGTI